MTEAKLKNGSVIFKAGYLNRIRLPENFFEHISVDPEDLVEFKPMNGSWIVTRHAPAA